MQSECCDWIEKQTHPLFLLKLIRSNNSSYNKRRKINFSQGSIRTMLGLAKLKLIALVSPEETEPTIMAGFLIEKPQAINLDFRLF